MAVSDTFILVRTLEKFLWIRLEEHLPSISSLKVAKSKCLEEKSNTWQIYKQKYF